MSVQAKIVGSVGSIGNADVPTCQAMRHDGCMPRASYTALIQIRAPEMLARALDRAACGRLTSRSDYIRAALLDRLREDGIDLDYNTNSASSDDQ